MPPVRFLLVPLLALTLQSAPAAAAETFRPELDFLRIDILTELHFHMLAHERAAADCERGGFAEGEPLRQALARVRSSHAALLAEAGRVYASDAGRERHAALADRAVSLRRPGKERRPARAACLEAARDAARLEPMLSASAASLQRLKEPPPELESAPRLSRAQSLAVLYVVFIIARQLVEECERRGFAEAGLLRRNLEAAGTARAGELAEGERVFKSGGGTVSYELGLEGLRQGRQTLEALPLEDMRRECRQHFEFAAAHPDDPVAAAGLSDVVIPPAP